MTTPWDALYARGPLYHGPAPAPWFAGELPPAAVVLDLGCGAGKSLRALRGAGPAWRLLGLDASVPGLRQARAAAPVACADAARLPLRAASVDAVRIDFLLGHLDAAARASCATEVERVLRPGGALEARASARGDLRDVAGARARGGVMTHFFGEGELPSLFPRCPGEARIVERAVRFAPRPRRVAELRARRA